MAGIVSEGYGRSRPLDVPLQADTTGEDSVNWKLAYDEHHSDAKEFCQVSGAEIIVLRR